MNKGFYGVLPVWLRKNNLPKEAFFKEGSPAAFCLIITSGRVEIYREEHLPQRLHIIELGAGEILGELAIIDGLPHSASAIALEDTNTLAISAWDFKAQLQAYPEIALELLPVVAKRLRYNQTYRTKAT